MIDWKTKNLGVVKVFQIGVEKHIHKYNIKQEITKDGVKYDFPKNGDIIRVPKRGSYKIQSRLVKMDGTIHVYVKHEKI